MTPPVSDAAFARWLAARAGEELLALRADMGYDDPAALREAGDKRGHDALAGALRRWRPADAVLSEEGVWDDQARLTAQRVWIVDPLDGTREFGEACGPNRDGGGEACGPNRDGGGEACGPNRDGGGEACEPGRTDWAVHVALWQRGSGLVAGAVALPAQHRVLGTDRPPPYPPLREGRLRIAVSRTRAVPLVTAVAEQVGAELVPMGSAGAKIAAVVTGEVDAYLHAGGFFEWDSAAPVAVARATGLHASRIDGSTLEYNQADPSLPDLLVCRRDLADRLLAAIRENA